MAATHFAGAAGDQDEDKDAVLAASRGVCEVYSEELGAGDVSARTSSVRLFLDEHKGETGFEVTVADSYREGFDHARVRVPTGFVRLGQDVRTHTVLDVVHAGITGLGDVRRWDRTAIDAVRDRVLARGLVLQELHAAGVGAYSSELWRVVELLARGDDWAAWCEATPYRSLRLQVRVPDPRWDESAPRSGARKQGEDLIVTIGTERAGLPDRKDTPALTARASQDVYDAIAAAATRRGLAAPSALPERLLRNRAEWWAEHPVD